MLLPDKHWVKPQVRSGEVVSLVLTRCSRRRRPCPAAETTRESIAAGGVKGDCAILTFDRLQERQDERTNGPSISAETIWQLLLASI